MVSGESLHPAEALGRNEAPASAEAHEGEARVAVTIPERFDSNALRDTLRAAAGERSSEKRISIDRESLDALEEVFVHWGRVLAGEEIVLTVKDVQGGPEYAETGKPEHDSSGALEAFLFLISEAAERKSSTPLLFDETGAKNVLFLGSGRIEAWLDHDTDKIIIRAVREGEYRPEREEDRNRPVRVITAA